MRKWSKFIIFQKNVRLEVCIKFLNMKFIGNLYKSSLNIVMVEESRLEWFEEEKGERLRREHLISAFTEGG